MVATQPAGPGSQRAPARASQAALLAVLGVVVVNAVSLPVVASIAEGAERFEPEPIIAVAFPVVALTFSATAVVIHRHERNAVGWVLHGIALGFTVTTTGMLVYVIDEVRPLGLLARLIGAWFAFAWLPALVFLALFLPLLFPTGRPPSPRWWWVGAAGAIALVLGFALLTVEVVTRPFDEVLAPEGAAWPLMSGIVVGGAVGGIASVVTRFRRAGPDERRQLSWVLYALSLVALTVALSMGPVAILYQLVFQVVFVAALCAVPVSIGIAITRFHLYDIDRIVSRTVAYTMILGTLALVYLGVVLGLQAIVPAGGSELVVAGATLVVAALFAPLRRRVQRRLDRRFDRTRYEAVQVLDAFGQRVRREIDRQRLAADLVQVADRTVQPASASLWFAPRRSEQYRI
jgi:hypothetical protein